MTLGTFDYISPEQARDPRSADVRSDIYSLGCTFYFMLTGRPPFPDGTVLQKLLQHQADEPPDPRGVARPILPEELLKILHRMLAKSPTQRYQQPAALMPDLLALASKYGLPAPATSSSLWPKTADFRQPLVIRHLPWLVPVGVLLVAALVVALVNRSTDADIGPRPIRHLPAGTARADRAGRREIAAANIGQQLKTPETSAERESQAPTRRIIREVEGG